VPLLVPATNGRHSEVYAHPARAGSFSVLSGAPLAAGATPSIFRWTSGLQPTNRAEGASTQPISLSHYLVRDSCSSNQNDVFRKDYSLGLSTCARQRGRMFVASTWRRMNPIHTDGGLAVVTIRRPTTYKNFLNISTPKFARRISISWWPSSIGIPPIS